ncbi:MAG: hypothetical protein QXN15_04440 [Candidatus Jordarchaeales archaeon]|nr:HEPN domain-containing protein [Candidatus Jordarchaeia archaeon]
MSSASSRKAGKGELMLNEAIRDLEAGCFNKATGGFYFAVRWFAERLLFRLGAPVPRRDDKLANAIENVGAIEPAEILRTLYDLRLKADYSDLEVTSSEVIHAKKTSTQSHKRT